MVEDSGFSGSGRPAGTRPPDRIPSLPTPPDDNARKRFLLERERRRAERRRKDDKDAGNAPDRWDGASSQERPDPPEPAPPPAGEPGRREEGGLDVVA